MPSADSSAAAELALANIRTKPYPPLDCTGTKLGVGDRVRVVGQPDLSGMAPASKRESEPVFARLVGTYRRISDFDEHGHAELVCELRGGPEAGLHWVWLEPWLVRKHRPRA